MSKTLKVIYSTLAVVMIVNSVAFVLPAVGYAQAAEKQAIEQIELSRAQQAELEKAQKEAKLAMYKELNLSPVEQKFVEKYLDKMESFSKVLDIDKYVKYNKTNGNAVVNAGNIYKDIKSLSTAMGLTHKEVIVYKDIALKMVKNYNKIVNRKVDPALNKEVTTSHLRSNTVSDVLITKSFLERGVKFEFVTDISIEQNQSLNKAGFNFDIPFVCRGASLTINTTWWGIWGVMNDCMVSGFKIAFNVIFGTIVARAAMILGGPLGFAFGVAFTYLSNTYATIIDRINRECGYRGVGYAGTWANFYAPWIRKVC